MFDPAQATLPELMALAGPDDDPCDSDFWVDIETSDVTGLTTRIAHAIPIRAWSRSHVFGPWQPHPLLTSHKGPVIETWLDDDELLFGAPGDLRRLAELLDLPHPMRIVTNRIDEHGAARITGFPCSERGAVHDHISDAGRGGGIPLAAA